MNILSKMILFFVLINQNCFSAIIYVDINATGNNNGSSWEHAFTDLQNGIGAALPGDQIWVAKGIYKPTNTTSRHIRFSLPNTVELYGGFAGNETQIDQRNWILNETILSGDIGVPGLATDNSYLVVRANNVTSATRLDGFKIIGGYNDGGSGGGMYITNSSLTVANCTFMANFAQTAGGAISHTGSGNLNLINCNFYNNVSGSSGGAVDLRGNQANIVNCNFSDNQAGGAGGGLYFRNGLFNIDRTVVSGNTANTGGAVHVYHDASINIYNSLFVGNQAVAASVLRISTNNNQNHIFWNNTVAHNRSTGGELNVAFVNNGITSFRNNIFWENIGIREIFPNNLDVAYCIVYDGYPNGTNIITSAPQFVNPGSGLITPFNASNYDYTLLPTSPAINTGSNNYTSSLYNLDLNDSARISGGIVDLGCYEFPICSTSASITTSGTTSICQGESVVLTASDAVNYQWSNGSTSQSITISTEGNYTVTVIDSNGCFGTASQQVIVNQPNIEIIGNDKLCIGGNLTLTATPFSALSYIWSNGETTQSITVNSPGLYSVTITDANGCVGSESKQIDFENPNIQIIGNDFICNNQSTTLTASSSDGTIFTWSTGSIDDSINIIETGIYSVTVTTSNGCTASTSIDVDSITVNAPTITQNENVLTSNIAFGNQWYLDGNPIPSANDQVYHVIEDGDYTATITENGCESPHSNMIAISTINSISTISNQSNTIIFPNPSYEYLIIESDIVFEEAIFYDFQGRVSYTSVSRNNFIDMSKLINGVYLLKLISNNEEHLYFRVVKQ